jgi:hypothetical protein
MFDPEKFGEAMGEAILKAVQPLHAEIAALKRQLDGMPDHSAAIAEQVAKAVSALPPAAPGASITLDDVRPVLDDAIREVRKDSAAAVERLLADGRADREALQKAVRELRQPEDGKSVTAADLAPLVREEVQKAVGTIPVPKDGAGLAGAMIDRDGALLVTLTNGEVKSLGRVVGKDGQDGISLDSFDLDYLEETHEVRVKAACGGRTKEMRYPAGGLRPAGYWREGTKAKACETWVHDGSLWIAIKDTSARPETSADGWIIAARKGRDGHTVIKSAGGPAAPIKIG